MTIEWREDEARRVVDRYAAEWGEALALRTYSSRLLGSDPRLVLHGGGNTSVKATCTNVLGRALPALYVKASGRDLATIEPDGHPALDLGSLLELRVLASLSDEAMLNELRTHLFRYDSPTPSVETLVHAFLPATFIDHTHADAILALTNREHARETIAEALGDDVIVLEYVTPGFALARAAAAAAEARPGARAMVWMHHGLVTWGETARESLERTVELASKAEAWIARRRPASIAFSSPTPLDEARRRLRLAAPLVRGLLSPVSDGDALRERVVLQALVEPAVLDFLDAPGARDLALTPPLTTDHLIRTKALPAWVSDPDYGDPARLKTQIASAVEQYAGEYRAYLDRQASHLPAGLARFDPLPRLVMLPGLGVLASGRDVSAAAVACDIAAHTLAVKAQVASTGVYRGLSEADLAGMEYRPLQHAKLAAHPEPLAGRVAVVTGAAGAIGAGVCDGLLERGCHVAATDLAGEALDSLHAELAMRFGRRVLATPLDVTDAGSVAAGFATVVDAWGGVDLVVINAGVALVSALADMDLDAFRRLERVNVEGTLLLLREAGAHFRLQGIGGDIVLVSTKNVFAPGAKFGAYSATKAASHQLARIASLEMADLDVRVNMVSPDAVFGHADRRSGLWKEVGPDRMRARGLDEAGLEAYYRNRNLLKARVTARHVANAVIFFATRQTPTTGATIPVDGGLPDATPR
jgi:rhamnose utilization protein RhaD (predicted bifunctional aldolase and dehydrogenase)/NAD(P)-dependent dehydrogenase (short-subunit alcohol dehydrogenase family)